MSKDFIIRLHCPYGDDDCTVLLENRAESLAQILGRSWDFECPVHGVQREIPISGTEGGQNRNSPLVSSSAAAVRARQHVLEQVKPRSSPRISVHIPVIAYGGSREEISFDESTVTLLVNAGGGLITMKTKVTVGETIFVVNQSTKAEQECQVAYVGPEFEGKPRVGFRFKQQTPSFWKIAQHEIRISKLLRVWVSGEDRKGRKFSQSAMTLDISTKGAKLDGIGYLTSPGDVIAVKRGWKKARFRVVWVGDAGPQSGQAGIYLLDIGTNIWGAQL